jgi:hypothetical protein
VHGGDLRAIKGRMLSHAKPVPLRSIAPDRLCLFRRSASHAQAATTRQFEMDVVIMTVLVQVINLDRSPERLRAIGADLALAGLEWTRLPAIEPDKDYATTLPSYQRARAHYLFGRDLTRGEVGCFASHLMALRALVNSGYETGLILEDDAQPDQDMGQKITDIAAALASTSPNWACVNLSYTTRLAASCDRIRRQQHFVQSLSISFADIRPAVAQRSCKIICRLVRRHRHLCALRQSAPRLDRAWKHWHFM